LTHNRLEAVTHATQRRLLLGPDPFALGAIVVAIIAVLDAATPTNARFGDQILPAIQPTIVYGAFQRIYARLFQSVNVLIN
jgi:hypothetical protein